MTNRLHAQNKNVRKVLFDFGPYPFPKHWQCKLNGDQKVQQELYLPPDEDNFDKHGIQNLVIKYSDDPVLKVDNIIHKHTHFYRKRMMEGVTDRLVNEINEHLEPVKEQISNLDRLSFLFLSIGIFATFLVAILVWFTINLYAAIFLMVLYLLILALVFYRNHLRQQFLQQKVMVNMAIIIYLYNQNIFH